jgi:2-phospho-L-lactate guanylyltransferase
VTARTSVVVPVQAFEHAKSRLGAVLDAEERRDLVEQMLRGTLSAALAAPDVLEVLVVSPDREVLEMATALGARPVEQLSRGLNPALQDARAVVAGSRLLILPADLPGLQPSDIGRVLEAGTAAGSPSVVLVPDRHGTGTNALLLDPPDAIDPAFGGDSRAGHAWLSASADIPFEEVDGVLDLDVDTPEDLLLAQAIAPEALHAD